MCGFCIEGLMTLDFLESEMLNTEFVMESEWTPIYVQEANNFIEILKKIKNIDGFSGSIDVAFCRLYEVYISRGFQSSIFDYIVSVYEKNELAKFFGDRAECGAKMSSSLIPQEFWSRLWSQDTYRNQSAWENFTNDTDSLVKDSESLLKNYCDWWILGKDKEESDPMQRMEETGVMDPIDDTPESERKKFYFVFPSLYFALSVLHRYRPNSEVINFIALNCPKNTPDFPGYDLWLQRQAFLVCIQEYGVPFIREHLEDIRLELIAYAVLKLQMTTEERESIKDIVSKYQYGVMVLEPDNVTQLIADVQAQEALRQEVRLN